jgi:site-specific DNA-methyltransferase (adenine-specific)
VQLLLGDFREIGDKIPDNSIDLIFTDPPYLKKYIPVYGDLGKFAYRKLKDGGSLVCYVGHYNLKDYLDLLGEYLTYWWIFCLKLDKVGFPMNNRRVVPRFKPLLWYIKGKQYKGKYIYDHIDSKFEGKQLHKWQQSTVEANHIISRMTEEGDTVCDPFLGSGSTGVAALELHRNFIGIEQSEETYNIARDRLQHCAICGTLLPIT